MSNNILRMSVVAPKKMYRNKSLVVTTMVSDALFVSMLLSVIAMFCLLMDMMIPFFFVLV